jgi:hypothetical protein
MAVLEMPSVPAAYVYVTIKYVLLAIPGYQKQLYALEFMSGLGSTIPYLLIPSRSTSIPQESPQELSPEGEIQVSSDGTKLLWSYFTAYSMGQQTGKMNIAVYNLGVLTIALY